MFCYGKSIDMSDSLDLFKNYFPAILNSFRDGIWVCDSNGKILLANGILEEINGIKVKQMLGENMLQLAQEGLTDYSIIKEGLEKKAGNSLIQKKNTQEQVLVSSYPIFDEAGKMVLLVITERDLSELTRLRIELDKSRSLAREYCTEISQLLTEQSKLSEIVARSNSTLRCLRKALRVARVESNVIIEGESGVGKSLVAKLIHRHSMVKDGPFIQVDCGAIPESLIESELFGYEPGAFTGAITKGKLGLFELADSGTLFLDEVGELPLSMQVKLLRFVESNEFLRVGGTTTREIKVRILAATNKNLSQMVQDGTFRRDLFFRLSVVPLYIPPLRERQEDIPGLCIHILDKFKKEKGFEKKLSPEVLDRLMIYNFPGNVRELMNIMERMIVMSENAMISLSDLPHALRIIPNADLASNLNWEDDNFSLKVAVNDFEIKIINIALRKYSSMAGAARALGLKPSTLWRKVKRLGIKAK